MHNATVRIVQICLYNNWTVRIEDDRPISPNHCSSLVGHRMNHVEVLRRHSGADSH